MRAPNLIDVDVSLMLNAGTKLGPYEVVAPLGAGGMGEVYRARDTKLGREVALKLLPAAFSADAERMARFRREAQVLASLNHPNIAAIYGFEDSSGVLALVMELVEGPTLADRIAKGAIPVDEALPIAKQICEGLEYAHERGIVHRDLKPANIKLASHDKLSNNDAVKILDFGLAKALEGDPASVDISSSPTISRMATQAGIILGTAAYMSPEQAKGKSVDRRADIWAFGCVLYEMLTGKMAFGGETVTDTLAAVIRAEPDWLQLPANTPPRIRELLQRCLKKDPRQRLQSIGDARIALEETLSGAAQETSSSGAGAVAPISAPAWRRALPWGIAGLSIAAALILLVTFWGVMNSAKPAPIELSLDVSSGQELFMGSGPAVVVSRDGSRIAYVAGPASGGSGQIYVRELDKSEAIPLAGAQGSSLFFSPDGQWIGFYGSEGKLEKVSVFGGTPVVLCDVGGSSRGGSWDTKGTILFTPSYTSPLYVVSAAGGTPRPVTHLDKGRGETTHRWPQVLPGGTEVLFTASADNNDFGHAFVEAASLATGEAQVLVENAYFGRYLSSGYLTYVSGGTLFAVPFDVKKLKLTGTAMPVLQNLQANLTDGSAQVSFSETGTAVYIAGATFNNQVTVGLFDGKGVATPLIKEPGDYAGPVFSPDGKLLALQVGTSDISVYDLSRGTMTSLTFPPAGCNEPVWTPNGKMIACNRTSGGVGLSWLPSDGTGNMKPLTPGMGAFQIPASWSPDGGTLAFFQFSPKTGGCCEIWTIPVSASGQPGQAKPYFGQGAHGGDSFPEISPDGHWMAYQSSESGTPQIYVVPFPDAGGKWQISAAGGIFPLWSKAGHELFFIGPSVAGEGALAEVPYSVEGNSFHAGKPELLFQGGFELRNPYIPYSVAPDGKHFAMLQVVQGKTTAPALPTVVVNWFARLQSLVAAGQK
ncbi:MAG: protein kinase [Candidatus Acidiferrales bacterium]